MQALVRFSLVVLVLGLLSPASAQQTGRRQLEYPKTPTVDVVDDYHGMKVADPYRWLEELDSPQTAEWVQAQNELTFKYLAEIPARERIRQRLTRLWDFEKYGVPFREGGRYFYSRNDGLQPQFVVYVADSLEVEPRVLIDPNKFSADGTVALAGLSISDDGRLAAYGVSSGGSDWVTYKVRNVDTGEDLPDEVKWTKFSGASWTKDGRGFFYSRFDEPQGNKLGDVNYYQKLYYHRIGTPQSADELVYHRPDQKEWEFSGSVTEDGRYLIIAVFVGTERKNRIYYQDLTEPSRETVRLLDDFDAQYEFVGNDGPVFWFFTDLAAPRGRVIAIDTRRPQREHWEELIPEAPETLAGVSVVGDRFIARYLRDAHSVVRLFDFAGRPLGEVALPGLGSVGGFGGKRTDRETFYSFSSFSTPGTIYRYDLSTGQSTVFRRPKVDFDPDRYETRQVFYNSKDGTRIPMFITHRKGLKLDGNNPTFLYGYGGFNVSLTPYFSVARLAWMEMGGVYALANIRGGGEYGTEWHDAGRLHNKQNCFDDFIAAAEYLVNNQYTNPKKLAIAGESNGGLLVGACMTQRPDLFGACLPAVGVLDMLRFTKFTIGWEWVSDYGSPDDPEGFRTLYRYSPLHNIKPGVCYPATLVTTADHDDRVVPAHSFKFIAALQAAQGCDNPVLIRIETRAGHGGGKPTQKIIDEVTDQYAFLVRVLDMDISTLGQP